ncbi:MAG: ABC transporter ATP-binding protein [Lachnospiraceae bacterium]|nr:ABC transporter ATP-binding protein [Lachnospiraceae bacterium]
MLECRDITKHYGSKAAIDHVSLALEPGHIYALLGPNGSGKTTLMKMAVGLVKPNEGGFYYDNQPIDKDSRKAVSYMPTEAYFYDWMTAEDVGKYYSDFFEDFSMERYQYLLKQMELDPKKRTKALSSGMTAKLKVAVTMARKSRVYLLDEPLNGIDLLARDLIIRLVLEECAPDTALVISSHLVEELESVVDTAIFLKEGRVVLTGDTEKLRKEHGKSVVDLYREIYGHHEEAITC